ncbi:hypothetical protein EC988_005745, partial [Linderina pennispora]
MVQQTAAPADSLSELIHVLQPSSLDALCSLYASSPDARGYLRLLPPAYLTA